MFLNGLHTARLEKYEYGCVVTVWGQVAGSLPDITVADVMAVGFTPSAEMGMWQYDFSDPTGPQVCNVYLQLSRVLLCGRGFGI